MESHHGVMSAWFEKHFGELYNRDKAPAVLMDVAQHDATRDLYNKWRKAMKEKMGGTFDWAKVTYRRYEDAVRRHVQKRKSPGCRAKRVQRAFGRVQEND
jgi:hypothetical protein